MKKKNLFSQSLKWVLGVSAAAALFVGCKNYDDDIDNLQKQITENKAAITDLQTKINAGFLISKVESNPVTTDHPNGGWKITFTGTTQSPIDIWNGKDGTPGTPGTPGAPGAPGTQWRIGAADTYYWEYLDTSVTPNVWRTSEPPVSAKGQDAPNGANAITVSPTTGNYMIGTTDTGMPATMSYCIEYDAYFLLHINVYDETTETYTAQDLILPKYGDAVQSIEFVPSYVSYSGDPVIACAAIRFFPSHGQEDLAVLVNQSEVKMKFRLNPTGLDGDKIAFHAFNENTVELTRATTPIFTQYGTPAYTQATGLYELTAHLTRTPRTIPTYGGFDLFATPSSVLADQVALEVKNIKEGKDGEDLSTYTQSKFINISYKQLDVCTVCIEEDDNDVSILKNSNFGRLNAKDVAADGRVVNIEYNLNLDGGTDAGKPFNLKDSVNVYIVSGMPPILLSNYFANQIDLTKATTQATTGSVAPAKITLGTDGLVTLSTATLTADYLNKVFDFEAVGSLTPKATDGSNMVADVIIRVKFVDRPVAKSYPIGVQNFTQTGPAAGTNAYWNNNTTDVATDDYTLAKMITDLGLAAKGVTVANFATMYAPQNATATPSFYPLVTNTFCAWVKPDLEATRDGKDYPVSVTFEPTAAGVSLPVINVTGTLKLFLPTYSDMVKFRPMWLPEYTGPVEEAPAPTSLFIKGIGTTNPWNMEGPMSAGFEAYTLPTAYTNFAWILCDANGVDKTTELNAEGVTLTAGVIELDYTNPAALEYINKSKSVYVKAQAKVGAAGQLVAIQAPFQVQFGMPLAALAASNAVMEITEVNNDDVSCYMLNAVKLMTMYEQTTQRDLIVKATTPVITNQVTFVTDAETKYGVIGFGATSTVTIELDPTSSLPATGTFELITDPASADFGKATWINAGTALPNDAIVKIIITIKNTWNDGTHGSQATKDAVKYTASLKIKKNS